VDEAMVRLNLAVAPNAWLMPARMVINTESTIGYNNKLKQAVGVGDETGDEQQCEPGREKSGDNPDGREDNKKKSTTTAFKARGNKSAIGWW